MTTASDEARIALGLSETIPTTLTTENIISDSVLVRVTDGTGGVDEIEVTSAIDYAFGNGGADELSVFEENSSNEVTLYGGAGDDTLGIDPLTSGSFSSGYTIHFLDFEADSDKIDLSELGYLAFDELALTVSGGEEDPVEVTIGLTGSDALGGATLNIHLVLTDVEDSVDESHFIFADTSSGGVLHDAQRTTLELSGTLPSSVTSYTKSIDSGAGILTFNIIDGTIDADAITGAANTSFIFGGAGNDTLVAIGEGSRLFGGAGEDIFRINVNAASGRDGNVYDFEVDTDVIDLTHFGIESFDELTITAVSETAVNDFVPTATYQITSTENGLNLGLRFQSDSTVLDSGDFIFGADADTLTGTSTSETLTGGSGNDVVDGGLGSDTLFGGANIADLTDGSDTITGGQGADLVFGNAGNDVIYADRADGSEDSTDGRDNVFGGLGSDTIYGGGGNDLLAGGGGIKHPADEADSIVGGGGSDVIVGNGDNDTLIGGTDETDTTDGADYIFGGLGDDEIYGSGGADVLMGQAGNDTLAGGAGADAFLYYNSDGDDVITDFASGTDLIYIFNNLSTGVNTFAELDATVADGNTTLDLGGGNSITLLGVTTFTSANVIFSTLGDFIDDFLGSYDDNAISF